MEKSTHKRLVFQEEDTLNEVKCNVTKVVL